MKARTSRSTSAPIVSAPTSGDDPYRMVVEDLTETICRLRPDGTLSYVNDVFCRTFGRTRDEFINHSWQSVAVAEDVPMIESRLRSLTPANPTVTIENRIRDFAGQIRWMQFVNRAFFDTEGRLLETQSVGRDITERKAAEEREASNLHLIVQGAPSAAVLKAIVLNVEATFAGLRCTVMLAGETGTHLRMGAAPSMPAYVIKALDGLPIGPDIGVCGVATFTGRRVICPDVMAEQRLQSFHKLAAQARLCSCWSEPITSSSGKVLGAFACYHREPHTPDQTELQFVTNAARLAALALEREKQELALKDNERKLSVIYDNAPGVLFYLSVEPGEVFRFISANHAFSRITGVPVEQVIGKRFDEIIPPESRALVLSKYREAITTKQSVRWEETSTFPNGEKHGEVTVTPIVNDAGEVTQLVGIVHDITARKQAEHALKLSEERYARALRGTTDGLWDWDIVTGETYLSPRWKEMLGFAEDELPIRRQEAFLSRLHPDDFQKIQDARQAHFERGLPYQVEFRLRTKDETYKWFMARGQSERNERGEAVRLTGTISDITERIQARHALEDSEQRFRAVFEQAAVGVAVMDTPTGRFLSVNQRMCEIIQRSREELLQLTFKDITCSEDLPKALQFMDDLKAGRIDSYNFEKRNVTPSGAITWVNLTVSPMWHPGEPPLRHIAVVEDITERKQVELNYRREMDYNQALLSYTSVFIVVLDVQGRFVHANPAFYNTMGYREKDVLGKAPWDFGLMDADEAARSKERLVRLLRGEENPPRDARLRTKSGQWRSVELRSTSTRKPDGSPDRIVITGADVTERNNLQQEILRVVEQEQARVGHDLHDGVGQTMTGIIIMMEALEDNLHGPLKADAQRIHELLRESVAEVRRMSHGLSPTSVKYREVSGALNLLAETVRTNFRTPCLCEVDASIDLKDKDQQTHLFRIAQEAVNNALRHGKPKQIKLSLKHLNQTECELRIEDDGVGMKKGKSNSDSPGGIGVRVMDYRANLIGGRLKIEPRAGQGTIVTCRFKCSPAKPA